jgi:hypothetical protein
MDRVDPQSVGRYGETFFAAEISKLTNGRSLFIPRFLGDSWPLVDYYVELHLPNSWNPFFFVQVKATTQGLTANKELDIPGLDENEIEFLAARPAPSYIAGVDVRTKTSYLLAVTGKTIQPLNSMPTDHVINDGTRQTLFDEVQTYWSKHQSPDVDSHFTTSTWP